MRYFRLAVLIGWAAIGSNVVFAQEASTKALDQNASYFTLSENPTADNEENSLTCKPDCEGTAGCCGECRGGCGGCFGGCCGDALWIVNAGIIGLTRARQEGKPIIRGVYPTQSTLLTASDFDYNWGAGVDIDIVRRLCNCSAFQAIDFRYFGVGSVEDSQAATPPGLWQFPSSLTPFSQADINSTYDTRLHSAEINLFRDSSFCRLTWLAGFRWIDLEENLTNAATFRNVGIRNYTFSTENDLYGAQVGAIIRLLDGCGPFQISVIPKGGIYGNTARNRYDAAGVLAASDSQNQVAFVGDLSFLASYCIGRHWAIQGGYQLLWIEGAAAAGDQPVAVNEVTRNGINSNGSAFYHGLTAGLTYCW